ncbi:MAG: hypothetical protein PHU43_01195 [Candidatus Bipolaricaulis sp.]|nr:hypothetical protein [Candidatus Bipolaricaulis sp.]
MARDSPSCTVPYVPRTYRRTESTLCTFWTSPREAGEHLRHLRSWTVDAARFLSETLGFRPTRRLHVVSFQTNEEARRFLGREVPPTMALAPYAGDTHCLVAVQSADADARNDDPQRMRGILVHEIAHQLIAEKTGSTKRLGDANRLVRCSTWLNEGLAELLRFHFLRDMTRIEDTRAEFERAQDALTWRDVDHLLDDLDGGRRAAAFVRATGAVAWVAQDAGVAALFECLPAVDGAVVPSSVCAVSALRRARELLSLLERRRTDP